MGDNGRYKEILCKMHKTTKKNIFEKEKTTREPTKNEQELIELINSLTEKQCQDIADFLTKLEEKEPLLKGAAKKYIDLLLSKK